jgi:hypothetical protein
LPQIRTLRFQIEATWRRFDFETFDKLEAYTLALHHAHALWRGASVSKADLPTLVDELSNIRDLLLANARALAAFGLIDEERLEACKTQLGYRPVATDVATIIEVLRENWSAVENKSPLTLPLLNDYAGKSLTLLTSIGVKDQAPESGAEAAAIRERAFARFVDAYADARRAVLYLRADHGDGEDIAPSLYANRTRRKSNGDSATTAPQSEVVRAEPQADGAAEAEGSEPQFDNAAGLPIGRPFTN